MRFAKMQDAMRDGYVVSERGWREGSKKGKLPSLARKRQQAHTNRLLHMLTAPENELMVLLNIWFVAMRMFAILGGCFE